MNYKSKNNEHIKYLENKRDIITSEIRNIELRLKYLQDEDHLLAEMLVDLHRKEDFEKKEYENTTGKCVHNWVYEGSDSHYSYDVCTKCRETSKY